MRSVVVTAVLLLLAAGPVLAQVAAFRYHPDAAVSGVVLHYRKSNLDGSHASSIDLFLAAPDRLESFKWSAGDTTATLVKAWLEGERLTVRRFESWQVTTGTRRMPVALEAKAGTDTLTIRVGDRAFHTPVRLWPWHSYDFDLASLGWAMRFLVAPERPFTVGITDPGPSQTGLTMREFGPVAVTFVRREDRHGRPSRRYTIDGPGLEQRGGVLWVDRETGFLVGFEIQKPDEDEMVSGKLELVGTDPMTETGWIAYQQARLRR